MIRQFLNKLWLDKERKKPKLMEEDQKRDALKMMAVPPMRTFLVSTMDELVRGAIYLNDNDRIGAKYTIELLTDLIKQGEKIIKKEEKKK